MKVSSLKFLTFINLFVLSLAKEKDVKHIDVKTKATYRAFYDEQVSSCANVVIIGVGTAMKTDAYDKLATKMAADNEIVVIINDPNPNSMIKTSAKKFKNSVNTIMGELGTEIPVCEGKTPNKLVVGGHSAAGSAAYKAVEDIDRKPDGFLGLDPYDLSDKSPEMPIPSLLWGYTEASCGVNPTKSVIPAYKLSEKDARILYQVNSDVLKVTHCSFTDNGCMGFVCAAKKDSETVQSYVAASVSVFFKSLHSGDFGKSSYENVLANDDNGVTLYVNGEVYPDTKSPFWKIF